jgi:hypothetical protein
MQLDELQVYHVSKKAMTSAGSSENLWASHEIYLKSLPGFFLNTCQRLVNVTIRSASQEESWGDPRVPMCKYQGFEAFLFLLRFATGLESEVQGETDIFGQIKEAWQKTRVQGQPIVRELDPWIQRLFEDTKDIRSRYLQNVGGSSYGALTRKVIRKFTKSDTEGPILIVGAGKIAQSIAPLLLEHDLWLWNRSSENLFKLFSDLQPRSKVEIQQFNLNDEERVWREARHVVACVPFDPVQDCKRIAWFREGGNLENRSIVHLGGHRAESGEWNSLPLFHSLDDLFELEKATGQLRSLQISKALKACEERAKLRSLGQSLSIPHGWEDLLAFGF